MRLLALIVSLVICSSVFSQVTTLEADIWPGSNSSSPEYLTEYNGKLYFSATNGTNVTGGVGRELWSYDGVTAKLEKNIKSYDLFDASESSDPIGFTVYNGKLYFTADDRTHGRELWVVDGDSVYMFKDLRTGTSSSNPDNFTEYNGVLYFQAAHALGLNVAVELFATNGDSVWLVADIYPGSTSGNPQYLSVYNNKLFFSARTPTTGYELFSYNGDSIKLEADIFPGTSSSTPVLLTVSGGNLYFSASIPALGRELWKFDGTTATLVSDIYPGTSASLPNYLSNYNGTLYFYASDGVTGSEIWAYDGTTLINWDLFSGGNSYLREFKVFNNILYFSLAGCADNYGLSCNTNEIYSFDGDTFQNVTNNFDIHPRYLTEYKSRLFFNARENTNTGYELWSYTPDSLCIPPKNLNVTPVNQSTVNLNWNVETNAIGYKIRGTEVGTGGFVTISVNGGTTTSYKAKGLFSSKTYAWQVKSICDVGFESDYSAFDTFKIDDFYCQIPVNYVTDITPTSAVLRWNVIPNAERYWIIGRDVNSPKLRSLNIYDGNQDSVWVQLAPGNTYSWQMRAECPTAPNVSHFTPVQFFSTPNGQAIKGELTFPAEADVTIFPNPMNDYAIIQSAEEIQEVLLVDMQGRLIMSDVVDGYHHQLDRGDLAPGMYVAIIRTESDEYRKKVIVD